MLSSIMQPNGSGYILQRKMTKIVPCPMDITTKLYHNPGPQGNTINSLQPKSSLQLFHSSAWCSNRLSCHCTLNAGSPRSASSANTLYSRVLTTTGHTSIPPPLPDFPVHPLSWPMHRSRGSRFVLIVIGITTLLPFQTVSFQTIRAPFDVLRRWRVRFQSSFSSRYEGAEFEQIIQGRRWRVIPIGWRGRIWKE